MVLLNPYLNTASKDNYTSLLYSRCIGDKEYGIMLKYGVMLGQENQRHSRKTSHANASWC